MYGGLSAHLFPPPIYSTPNSLLDRLQKRKWNRARQECFASPVLMPTCADPRPHRVHRCWQDLLTGPLNAAIITKKKKKNLLVPEFAAIYFDHTVRLRHNCQICIFLMLHSATQRRT